MDTTLALLAAIPGLLSLGGLIFFFAFWKGGMDTWRKYHEEEHNKYPLSEIFLMIKTMWDIYIVDTLHNRPDLAQHSSPFKLKQNAEDLIPEALKQELREISKISHDREDVASGWLVVKHLGMLTIENLAQEKKLGVPETVAVLSTYLDNHTNSCHPT